MRDRDGPRVVVELGPRDRYKSDGARPVFLAILASILGPISSPSWKANTKSGQPSRLSVRCDPDWRFSRHPILKRAARTRLVLQAGQSLTRLES